MSSTSSFDEFVAYTGTLNWFLPHAMIPTLAVVATCAEIVLGLVQRGPPARAGITPSGMPQPARPAVARGDPTTEG